MSVFDELSKDWKENKGRPSDFDKNLINKKNENVMDNLIQLEKKERKENRIALIAGGLGLLAMIFAGIILPIQTGLITMNPYLLIGALTAAAALLSFLWTARVNVFRFDASKMSRDYLIEAKESIQKITRNRTIIGVAYTVQLLVGMCLVNYGILSQHPEGFSLFSIFLPLICGATGLGIWKYRQNKKVKREYTPLIEEIDDMLKDF